MRGRQKKLLKITIVYKILYVGKTRENYWELQCSINVSMWKIKDFIIHMACDQALLKYIPNPTIYSEPPKYYGVEVKVWYTDNTIRIWSANHLSSEHCASKNEYIAYEKYTEWGVCNYKIKAYTFGGKFRL